MSDLKIQDLREFSRMIVTKIARDTAMILHVRNLLGVVDDCADPIEEADFCDEAEALATGEECGCLDPQEAIDGSLMVWLENQLKERISAAEQQLASATAEARRLRELLEQMECPITFSEAEAVLTEPTNMTAFIASVEAANQILTRRAAINREHLALAPPAPQEPRQHRWTGCRLGGSPWEASSYEWVRYCSVCGMEDTCEDPLPPCPGPDDAAPHAQNTTRHGHCAACMQGQTLERGEGTHREGTIEHPAPQEPAAGQGGGL